MNDLKVFQNEEFGSVRTIEIDGAPWFNATDVCKCLGFGNPRQALSSHVAFEDVQKLDMFGQTGRKEANFVNESGLYSLILGSKKPDAKRFKRWVTSEVLPSIRKHGLYAADELLNNPDKKREW